MSRRLICIGCSKNKHDVTNPRRGSRATPVELYDSVLFSKRVAYAESRGLPWVVLSAKYGVWHPHVEQKSYDVAMTDLTPAERAAWHAHAALHLVNELWEEWDEDETRAVLRPSQLTIELHAGRDYCEPLASLLRALGVDQRAETAGSD